MAFIRGKTGPVKAIDSTGMKGMKGMGKGKTMIIFGN